MTLIDLKRGRRCRICDVKPGEFFIFDEEVYMKALPLLGFENAVSLTSANIVAFSKLATVTLVKCKFES